MFPLLTLEIASLDYDLQLIILIYTTSNVDFAYL